MVIVSAEDPPADDQDTGSDVRRSACDLISAVLLFQLNQVGEVELAEGDMKTRTLLGTAVRAAGTDSGWDELQGQMAAALQAEQQARGERAHAAEVAGLLDFDRLAGNNDCVPVLVSTNGSGDVDSDVDPREAHSFRPLAKGAGENYPEWTVANRHA